MSRRPGRVHVLLLQRPAHVWDRLPPLLRHVPPHTADHEVPLRDPRAAERDLHLHLPGDEPVYAGHASLQADPHRRVSTECASDAVRSRVPTLAGDQRALPVARTAPRQACSSGPGYALQYASRCLQGSQVRTKTRTVRLYSLSLSSLLSCLAERRRACSRLPCTSSSLPTTLTSPLRLRTSFVPPFGPAPPSSLPPAHHPWQRRRLVQKQHHWGTVIAVDPALMSASGPPAPQQSARISLPLLPRRPRSRPPPPPPSPPRRPPWTRTSPHPHPSQYPPTSTADDAPDGRGGQAKAEHDRFQAKMVREATMDITRSATSRGASSNSSASTRASGRRTAGSSASSSVPPPPER
jgi:hypothetical protein